MNQRILVVEDEEKLARFIELELQYEGYEVAVAKDGMAGLTQARESSPDLLLLDWMLPGMPGLDVCRRLRETGNKVPIIIITAKVEIAVRVAGLDAEANDYIVKPMNLDELLAKIPGSAPAEPSTIPMKPFNLPISDLTAAPVRFFGGIAPLN